jgi:hypothetical protein
MVIITKVVEEVGKDPILTTIGIMTLEDIIKQLLKNEDRPEIVGQSYKGDRKKLKEKLVLLFSDN